MKTNLGIFDALFHQAKRHHLTNDDIMELMRKSYQDAQDRVIQAEHDEENQYTVRQMFTAAFYRRAFAGKSNPPPCLDCVDQIIMLCSDIQTAPRTRIHGGRKEIGCETFCSYISNNAIQGKGIHGKQADESASQSDKTDG